jgi:hypothetical protein
VSAVPACYQYFPAQSTRISGPDLEIHRNLTPQKRVSAIWNQTRVRKVTSFPELARHHRAGNQKGKQYFVF